MDLELVLWIGLLLAYLCLNLYVNYRISSSLYLDEDRRKLHRIFIWLLPFIGPLMIRNFWKKKKPSRLEIITKDKRKTDNSGFYESGIGQSSL